jgi:hypothetical protein
MNNNLRARFVVHDDRDASPKSTISNGRTGFQYYAPPAYSSSRGWLRFPVFTCVEDFEQARQGESKMNKADFAKLVASVKQAGKIRRGEMKASRVFNLKPVDVRAIHSDLRSFHQASIGYASSVSTVD